MANKEHLTLLKSGVEDWNEWRRAYPDVRPDLNEADLEGADLTGANFANTNLARSILWEANFSGAELINSYLNETELSRANLNGADLTFAQLNNANLRAAVMSNTKLNHADLTGTDLTGADFTGALMSYTSLNECVFLHEAKGLSEVVHFGPSFLDVQTLRACVADLPDIFLLGAGYTAEELPRLRAMYGGEEVPSDDPNTLTLRFDFPEEVRTQCEQYLLHFRRFLLSLGVQVRTEITETKDGEVCFSVTLVNQKIELDKIRKVLEVYIVLPEIPELYVSSTSDAELDRQNREHQRQVEHLQSQLRYEREINESKTQRIRSLEASVDRYPETIDGSVLRKSYQAEPEPEQTDKVDIVWGLVTVEPTELPLNVKIQTPKILRNLSTLTRKLKHYLAIGCEEIILEGEWKVEDERKEETKGLPPLN